MNARQLLMLFNQHFPDIIIDEDVADEYLKRNRFNPHVADDFISMMYDYIIENGLFERISVDEFDHE